MKKLLAVLVVAFTAVAVISPRAARAQSGGTQQGPMDPAEYNSYVAAVQNSNPQEKIAGLEGFLQRYPNTQVKETALEQLMTAYQQTGNAAKVFETAGKLLQANPNNLRGLAVMAYSKRAAAQGGQDIQQNSAAAEDYGQRGLKALTTATKPEGMADADFNKFKDQVAVIFHGAVGFGALQAKDYKTAQENLQAAVDATPENLGDVYPLALAYLQAKPVDPRGLWYAARAVNLSQNNADIVKMGQAYYKYYHGSDEGWDQIVAQAKTSAALPAGFSVTPAPSPAEVARNLMNSKDPKQMGFDDWQVILVYGDKDTADKCWNAIKGQTIAFVAKVVDASKTKLTLAATYEDIQSNTSDVEVTMIAPLPASMMPNKGDQIQIQGKPDTYTAKPFLVQMVDGQLIQAKKTPPARKAPPRRKKK